MLLTPHSAAAIAVTAVLPDPQLAIPVSFFSHFLLDMVPHWDNLGLRLMEKKLSPLPVSSPQFKIILLDALVSLTLGLFFVYRAWPDYGLGVTFLLAIFAANLPDMFYIPRVFFGRDWGLGTWVIKLQHLVQTHSRAPFAIGILTQVLTVAICLLIALR